jgi:hypothetical protein
MEGLGYGENVQPVRAWKKGRKMRRERENQSFSAMIEEMFGSHVHRLGLTLELGIDWGSC